MAINLGHLAIFHAVAEEHSVSRGAERLLVSQPAASKQLSTLEKSLRTTLFERTSRGVSLTEAGNLLLGYSRRIFSLEEEANRAIQELRGLKRGRLAIGASTTIGVYLLPEVFVEFRKHYPAIDATFEIANSLAVGQRVGEGALNVGFVEALPKGDGIKYRQVMKDELVAIVAPYHPFVRRQSVLAKTFCAEPFIVRATRSDTKSFVEQALSGRGLTVQAAMSLPTTEAIKRAVAAGIGVAIVSHLAIGLELKARTLATVRVQGLSIRRPLFQIVRPGSSPSDATTAFMDLLEKRLSTL